MFSALSGRSSNPQVYYERAGHMRDLTLGDAHVVPIDDRISREEGRDFVSTNNIYIDHVIIT